MIQSLRFDRDLDITLDIVKYRLFSGNAPSGDEKSPYSCGLGKADDAKRIIGGHDTPPLTLHVAGSSE